MMNPEAENLVLRLLDPRFAHEIEKNNRELQELQKSPEAWQIADGLLNSTNSNVRFFGALTFAVKLNLEGASLNEDELLLLLDKLISSLVNLHAHGEGNLVTQKVCVTLTTFFALPKSPWTFCIRHLLCCLSAGRMIPESEVENFQDTRKLLNERDSRQKSLILSFSQTLAEDMARVDHTSPQYLQAHLRAKQNIGDMCALVEHCLLTDQIELSRSQILPCYQAWIDYCALTMSRSEEMPVQLTALMDPIMNLLNDTDTFEAGAEFFTEVFLSNNFLVKQVHVNAFCGALRGDWAVERLKQLEEGNNEDSSNQFGQMILAFAQFLLPSCFGSEHATYALQQADIDQLMAIIHHMTLSHQADHSNQALLNAIVDYWEAFLVEMDDVHDQSAVCNHLLQAIVELCYAARLTWNEYNNDFEKLSAEDPFGEFRIGVRNIMQATYVTLGDRTITELVRVAQGQDFISLKRDQSLQELAGVGRIEQDTSKDMIRIETCQRLESVLYILVGSTDTFKHSRSSNEAANRETHPLHALFTSDVFNSALDCNISIPLKLRKLVIGSLGEFGGMMHAENATFLTAALESLFRCLEQPELAGASAQAIFDLCDHCRTPLVALLDQFYEIVGRSFIKTTTASATKERLAASLACVIQAINPEHVKINHVLRLLDLLEQDYFSQINEHGHSHAALQMLQQLAAVGRAIQTPEDEPIDLETEKNTVRAVWEAGDGLQTQERITKMMQICLANGDDELGVDLLTATCEVIKSGFREHRSGPFVFPAQVTVSLIQLVRPDFDRIDIALNLACAFVSSHSTRSSRSNAAVSAFLIRVCLVMNQTGHPRTDPDVAYSCVDLLSRISGFYLDQLLHLPDAQLNTALTFSLSCLDASEPLPKRAAADTWQHLLSPTETTQSKRLSALISQSGPALVRTLVFNFGGNASRSELDRLVQPFRKVVASRVEARKWIEKALFDEQFPSQRVNSQSKNTFAAQVIALRGDKRTNTVVKEFWLACRGTPIGYG